MLHGLDILYLIVGLQGTIRSKNPFKVASFGIAGMTPWCFPNSSASKVFFSLSTCWSLLLLNYTLETYGLPLYVNVNLRSRTSQETDPNYTSVHKAILIVIAILASALVTATYVTLISALRPNDKYQ
jgi:hypothetical protein